MIPPTQRDAYQAIIDSGSLNRMQVAVYRLLCESPGKTRDEIDHALAPGRPNAGYSRRLVELERMGVIQRVGVRVCTVTGRKKQAWFATKATEAKALPRRVPAKRALNEIASILSDPGGLIRDPRIDQIRRVLREAGI